MRHGQTDYNVSNRINCEPRVLIGLTETGKKQALVAREKLKGVKFDIIFTSEFLRTKESAEIVNSLQNVSMKVDKRLNEFNSGMEGESVEAYWKVRGEEIKDKFSYKLDGRESLGDVRKRVENFLEELKNENYENVLVVTHEAVVKAALRVAGEIPNNQQVQAIGNAEFVSFSL